MLWIKKLLKNRCCHASEVLGIRLDGSNHRNGKMGLQEQQIVHLLDRQAIIVNQTQQITHSSLLLIQELEKRSELLKSKFDYALDNVQQGELIPIQKI